MNQLKNNGLTKANKMTGMPENDKMAIQIHKKMKYPVNQLINNLTVAKIAKNCKKMTKNGTPNS
jgi:hypothetical protein